VGATKVGQDEDRNRGRDDDKDRDKDGGKAIEVPRIYSSDMNK
jgi:hypothetical protein